MKKVLLSIKPQFVEEIRFGKKIYEYRKSIFKDKSIDKMLIYSSSPIKKIVGECDIETIVSGNPNEVWEQTKLYGGITQDFFFEYFKNKETAYAIKMSNVIFYNQPFLLADIGVEYAPQSFRYVEL